MPARFQRFILVPYRPKLLFCVVGFCAENLDSSSQPPRLSHPTFQVPFVPLSISVPAKSRKPAKDPSSSATIGFDAKLWLAADKLRNNMDAAEYKHVVLGLIFLKYISDTFEEHRAKQNFRPIRVVLPSKELMAAFTAKVAPLYAQISANLHQSRTLATLRDTLLPKLLNGKLQANF